MAATKVGPKHQVTIPRDVFDTLKLEVGDLLEAGVDQGKIVLVPKRLADKAPAVALTAQEQRLATSARKKIAQIRKDLVRSKGLTLGEANVAADAGLIAHDQIWWWTEEWQKGEREVEAGLKAGKTIGSFTNADELIASLHKGTRRLKVRP